MNPENVFTVCKIVAFSLLFALWIFEGQRAGFLLIATLVMMSIIRNRIPKLKYTVLFDIIICLALSQLWDYAIYALALSLFSAITLGVYFAIISGAYLLFEFNVLFATVLAFSALCGLFLRFWALEYTKRLRFRDKITGKYYEMENFQYELSMALMDVERTTSISERTRIARDIHDNAGHEIVAAYISFQAIRKLLDLEKANKAQIITMYDSALKRLNNGTTKIRETAHNLQSTTTIGVDSLSEACRRFPICPIDFRTYGNPMKIPMYIWNVLSSCLNECLTNIVRHSHAKNVIVTLDVAKYIVRLCVENDGVQKKQPVIMGMGLRNIHQRIVSIGGNLSIDASVMFRVICVVPIAIKEDV